MAGRQDVFALYEVNRHFTTKSIVLTGGRAVLCNQMTLNLCYFSVSFNRIGSVPGLGKFSAIGSQVAIQTGTAFSSNVGLEQNPNSSEGCRIQFSTIPLRLHFLLAAD